MKFTKLKGVIALVIGILAMILLLCLQGIQLNKAKAERDDYQSDVYSMMSGVETLRNDSAKQAYQIQVLTLTVDEYKTYREEDAQTIQDLNLKIKNLTSVSKQSLKVQVPISAQLSDTVIVRDTIPIYTKAVHLNNDNISFNGTIDNDSLNADIEIPINLRQIVHKVPKHKFLWWTWGVGSVKQVITTDNPYVHLNYSEYVELK